MIAWVKDIYLYTCRYNVSANRLYIIDDVDRVFADIKVDNDRIRTTPIQEYINRLDKNGTVG